MSILYPVSYIHPVSYILYPYSCVEYPIFCILYPLPFILYPVSFILYSVSCILYPVFCILCSVFCIPYPLSFILYPVYCILFPLSFILYPVFCILYPVSCIPYILYSVPVSWCSTSKKIRSWKVKYSKLEVWFRSSKQCLALSILIQQQRGKKNFSRILILSFLNVFQSNLYIMFKKVIITMRWRTRTIVKVFADFYETKPPE